MRNLLLNRPIADWDLATDAIPDQVIALFKRSLPTGLRYGTVSVSVGAVWIQVTTFRSESQYNDQRHPNQVSFEKDILIDLSRRDFTINAMALDLLKAELIDPFGGYRDLLAHRLMSVGKAVQRLSEDALRMLRAARFIACLGLRPSPTITQATRQNIHLIKMIAPQRIGQELHKMLCGSYAAAGIRWMHVTGLLDMVWGLANNRCQRRQKILAKLPKKPVDTIYSWSLFLMYSFLTRPRHSGMDNSAITGKMESWALNRLLTGTINHLSLGILNPPHQWLIDVDDFHDYLAKLSRDGINSLMRCWLIRQNNGDYLCKQLRKRALDILRVGGPITLKDLKVNGYDLQKTLTLNSQKQIGILLKQLLTQARQDPSVNERAKLLNLVKQYRA